MTADVIDLDFRPLHDTIGAEVIGVDLSEPLDDDIFRRVYEEWLKRSILLFRGQERMTPEQQIGFTRRLGELEIFSLRQYTHPDHPEVFVVSNIQKDGKDIGARVEKIWHSDSLFLECPSKGALLNAKEVPSVGADTLFVSMFAVYKALPEETRDRIRDKKVLHSRITAYPTLYPNRPPLTDEEKARIPDVVHPLVRTHPETGQKSLLLGGGTAPLLVGLSEDESDVLLDELMAFATGPRFVYRHEWRVGDAILWDNRSSIHSATDYDEVNERRLMYRTTIAGDHRPV